LAGTTLPIDRLFVAELLGFDAVTENSMDAVADRDFAVEFLACAAICIMHVSRLAEDLILWCTEEFGFISMPDAFTTGSSIMPQKKNPDVAELMRGKTGRIYGNLMSLLTTLKGIPLTYNRDLQEDKEPVFDTVDTLKSTLSLLADMMQHVTFNSKRMTEASGAGFSTATDIAEYLVSKGVPFRSAHEITGRLVLSCIESAKAFTELTLDEFKSFSRSFEGDIFACITAAASVNARRTFGGTSIESVKEQIRRFRDRLNDK
jgi:argininosuccinate lyase